jgi:hypothetical protein
MTLREGADGIAVIDVPRPSLPLKLEVTYASNPKELDEYPDAAKLDGNLVLVIDAQGKLTRR